MINNIDPVLFSLGPLEIRYYGIIYMSGFLLAYFFILYLTKRNYLFAKINKGDVEEYIFYTIIWTVVGARLFEVLFYGFSYFMQNPLKIFAIWEGGLSFHGGLFGVISYTVYYSRKKKMETFISLDYSAIPASFALFSGRIANFINGELYGLPVENQVSPPWYAVKFVRTDPEGLYRIPVQLFESLGNFFSFMVLFVVWRVLIVKYNKLVKGLLSSLFLMFYGTFRFIIEIWKDFERDTFLGMTTGQLLCLPLILGGLLGFWYVVKNSKQLSYYLK